MEIFSHSAPTSAWISTVWCMSGVRADGKRDWQHDPSTFLAMSKSAAVKPQPPSAHLEKVGSAEKEPLLHPGESVEQAGEKMRKLKAETLPVVEGQRLVGSVDQPDPDRRAAGFGHDPHSTSV